MEFVFAAVGFATLAYCGIVSWNLLTDDDVCDHCDIVQHGGECQNCGKRIEIGGSE